MLPRGAALFLHSDQDVGPLSYASLVAGVRKDVRLYSQHGHLFGNRILGMGPTQEAERATLRRFLEREPGKRLFVTWPSPLIRSMTLHGAYLHDHGHVHELSLSERRTPLPSLSDVARAFLDRHGSGAYEDLWAYHRQRITGAMCRVLIVRGEDHPVLQQHYYCKVLLARHLIARKDNARAAEVLQEVLASGYPWLKKGLPPIYFHYMVARLAVINAKPAPAVSKAPEYQVLVDEVFPATEILPLCNNVVTRALLQLGAQGPLDIRFAALKESFGHCDNLLPLFARARRGRS